MYEEGALAEDMGVQAKEMTGRGPLAKAEAI